MPLEYLITYFSYVLTYIVIIFSFLYFNRSTAVDANTLLSACRTLSCNYGISTTLADTMNSNTDILKSEATTMNMNEVAGLGYSTTSTTILVIPATHTASTTNSTKIKNDKLASSFSSSSSSSPPPSYEGVWEAIIEMNCRHVENMAIFMRPSSSATTTSGGSDTSESSDEGLMECGLSGESVECYDVDNSVFQLNYLTKTKLMITPSSNNNNNNNSNGASDKSMRKDTTIILKPSSSSSISSSSPLISSSVSSGTLQRKQEINTMGGLMKITTSSLSFNYCDLSSQQLVQKQQADGWLAGKLLLTTTENTSGSSKDSKAQSLIDFIWVLPFSQPSLSSSSYSSTATTAKMPPKSPIITVALTHESNEPISYSRRISSTAVDESTNTTTATAAEVGNTSANTKNSLFPLLQENKIIAQQLQQQPEQIVHKYILWKRIV